MNPITELRKLVDTRFISLPKIEWWLMKYESDYQYVISVIDAIPSDYKFPSFGERYAFEFQLKDLYELLEEVLTCYKDEAYFKIQLTTYQEISSNAMALSSWLETHKLTPSKEQSKFKWLFADNREVTGYNLKLNLPIGLDFTMVVNPLDFHYSIKFLDIIDRSEKLEFVGIVKLIKPIDFFEKIVTTTKEITSTRPAYQRQDIVIAVDDSHNSQHQIKFFNGKTSLLKNIYVGQKVKVHVELRGGVSEKSDGVKEYWTLLRGWDIEILEDFIHEAEF